MSELPHAPLLEILSMFDNYSKARPVSTKPLSLGQMRAPAKPKPAKVKHGYPLCNLGKHAHPKGGKK